MAANIVVIDKDAHQCKEVTTKTNKGVYIWKATVSGVIKSIKCKIGNGVITHECDETGRWVNLNHSSCDYTNEFNRKLQILAAVIVLAFTSFISSPEPKAQGELLPSANVRRLSSVVRRASCVVNNCFK